MTKRSRSTSVPSRWGVYRSHHNSIRAAKNRIPMQRVIRSACSLVTRLWQAGDYGIPLVENILSRKKMLLPEGLPSAKVAQGSPLHFYDAQRAIIQNGYFLRFLSSSILKRKLVVLSVGNSVQCCPALFCQEGHKNDLPITIPPLQCDQCSQHGVLEASCEYCTAPRFRHM